MVDDEEARGLLLPDDVLAAILRRLSPWDLAACRCVCKQWRDVVNGNGMLLPRSLAGLVLSHGNIRYARLFARPGVDHGDQCMPGGAVLDCCNGLLLLDGYWVRNPATGASASVPEPPYASPRVEGMGCLIDQDAFLAFDPAASPHYEVFLIPPIPCIGNSVVLAPAMLRLEWPPSPFVLSVFSSRTGAWEERAFGRQGEAAGTVADMQQDTRDFLDLYRHAEYWQGILYVHCQTNYLMRISPSDSTYRVIKPPVDVNQEYLLGKSEKGIYYALLEDDCFRLRVWILDDCSCDQIEWRLRHDSGQGLAFPTPNSDHGNWVFAPLYSDDESSDDDESEEEYEDEEQVEEEPEWDSDDDSIIPTTNDMVEQSSAFTQMLAFHPYKEIVFFGAVAPLLAFLAAVVAFAFAAPLVAFVADAALENCAADVYLT
nr:unnamed protein product [Digitaria exilis]